MFVKHLDHLNLTVADLDRTERWYADLFGFQRVEGGVRNGVRWSILRAGDAMLCVYQGALPADHRPEHARVGLNHFALRITDRAAWEAAVARTGTPVHYGGAVDYPHSRSWYVDDPDGYEIEVALWDLDRVSFAA